MQYLLAADIGGTKSLLELSQADGQLVLKKRYTSADFASFEQLLSTFLQEAGQVDIDVACFAIAAPIQGRLIQVTNLPWVIDADAIARQFAFGQLLLCNDFEAVGYGVTTLTDDQLLTVQAGEPVAGAFKAVIGAGTGLGQAVLVEQNTGWQVFSTEGGHVDFAATDDLQIRLLEQLQQRGKRVSAETLLSGKGLETIYLFLRDYLQIEENPDCRIAMVKGDAAAAISEFANQDGLAARTMALFFSLYGAHVGNVALSLLPRQGIYIAGGIASKNLVWFERDEFKDALLEKAPMQHVVKTIPVQVILEPEVGLLGARLLAKKALLK